MHWLLNTREGFLTRLSAGLLFFLTLAILDLRRNGRGARRWREYVFLLLCVFVAIVYGVFNDQVTSRVSWEYFYYAKELDDVLGPQVPPDPAALSREAARIGIMATWSVGLLLGIALLIANNPRKRVDAPPQLPFARLIKLLLPIISITICCAIAFGALGWLGLLNWISPDFDEMWRAGIFRPRRFLCAWGAHLGGYVGGLLGGAFGVVRVLRERRGRVTSP